MRRILLLACASVAVTFNAWAESNVHNWKFVMAHRSGNAENVALIKEFTQRVAERTNNTLVIEPVLADNMLKRMLFDESSDTTLRDEHMVALGMVYAGDVQMSQVAVRRAATMAHTLDVLEMPMVFKNHEHASAVLDSQIGKDLLADLAKGTDGRVRGHAFTYSGGFRHIYSTSALTSVKQLEGLPMRLRPTRMERDAMNGLNLKPVIAPGGELSEAFVKMHDAPMAEEAEVNRLSTYEGYKPEVVSKIKSVLLTQHNLYLTALITSGPAFDALTDAQKTVLQEEADRLARLERDLSIKQEAETIAKLKAQGVTFVAMSADDAAVLDRMGKAVQAKHKDELGSYVDRILSMAPKEAAQLAR